MSVRRARFAVCYEGDVKTGAAHVAGDEIGIAALIPIWAPAITPAAGPE